MRRLVFSVTTALNLALSLALSAVVGAVVLVTSPATARADDNPTVCANARRTIETVGQGIVADLRKATLQSTQGDNAGADATVKTMGPKFSALGTQLQRVANTASDPTLKKTLTSLGTELGRVGQAATDFNALESFNQSQLNAQGRQLSGLCGFTPSAGGASGRPLLDPPSASPTS
jgi:hypothetical protein